MKKFDSAFYEFYNSLYNNKQAQNLIFKNNTFKFGYSFFIEKIYLMF